MTLTELKAELAKRGATAMVVFSADRDERLHVTITETEKSSDARDARPSERGYGSAADEDWDRAAQEALRKYDEGL